MNSDNPIVGTEHDAHLQKMIGLTTEEVALKINRLERLRSETPCDGAACPQINIAIADLERLQRGDRQQYIALLKGGPCKCDRFKRYRSIGEPI